MPRPQLSHEQRQKISASFILAAWSLMKSEGMEALTLRKVSAAAGYNSATLYQHFQDLDELSAYAALRFLNEYGAQLLGSVHGMEDPLERYYTIWGHFCRQAFRYPEAFYILYFGKYNDKLEQMAQRYDSMFPEDRAILAKEEVIDQLFANGPLSERNMSLLRPIAEAGLLTEESLPLRSEILLCCFKELLGCKVREGEHADSEALIRRHLSYIQVILEGRA